MGENQFMMWVGGERLAGTGELYVKDSIPISMSWRKVKLKVL